MSGYRYINPSMYNIDHPKGTRALADRVCEAAGLEPREVHAIETDDGRVWRCEVYDRPPQIRDDEVVSYRKVVTLA